MEKRFEGCPGAAAFRGTPELKEKTCPSCGRTIEMFTGDTRVRCECGFVAYGDAQSCVSWCAYARECVGDEMYEKFMSKVRL
ncbi:MAG: hypothetical protein FWC55_04835 [Firmicutes bacterium]|nr:hypothetical protein [Bacillota bacterium]